MSASHSVLAWSIAAGAIACVILRPKQWPEAVWACLGAVLLVACGVLRIGTALRAAARGTDVYLFLTGMMLLAELARREGVFDWLAGLAVRFSNGSRVRLFVLIYAVGVLVTIFLSNDATAVVLTPAVYAAVRRARADALSYLFICAFIANAASFVLPISNPANLVVYGRGLPPLLPWLEAFLVPSLCSIAATYVALRWMVRHELRGEIQDGAGAPALSSGGKRAAYGIAASAVVLMAASALGFDLGLPTCAAALVAMLAATRLRVEALRETVAGVSWSVLPLVAGLFVLVEGLDHAGAAAAISHLMTALSGWPRMSGAPAAAFGIAAVSNLMNNLPAGLLAAGAMGTGQIAPHIRDAVLIGVDLGPNLSVTGSLATILWLIALRREGIAIGGWRFLKMGAVVMPPALLAATAAAAWLSR